MQQPNRLDDEFDPCEDLVGDHGGGWQVHDQRQPYVTTPLPEPLLALNLECLGRIAARAQEQGNSQIQGQGRTARVAQSAVEQLLQREWAALPPQALERIARMPYALLDGGLGDAARWHASSLVGVRDAERTRTGIATVFEPRDGVTLLRRLLIYGWHLARTRPRAARLVMGAGAASIDRLAQCSLLALETFAEVHGPQVQLRWHDQPEFWLRILAASQDAAGSRLQDLVLVGVQRLAGQSVGVRPRGLR